MQHLHGTQGRAGALPDLACLTALCATALLALAARRPELMAAGVVLGPAAALAVEAAQQRQGSAGRALTGPAMLDPRD